MRHALRFISRTMYDLAHGFWNLAKNVIDLVCKAGKMNLKPARKEDEIARGRFRDLPSRHPWVASHDSLQTVAAHLMTLKVPVDWPANPPFGEGSGGMKIAEGLAICGERGQWIIDQLDIDDEYCSVIVGVLAAAAAFLKKVMTEEDLNKAHTGLVDALALAEALLPMQWCTITTHMLLHAADWVRTHHFPHCAFPTFPTLVHTLYHFMRSLYTNSRYVLYYLFHISINCR